MLKTTHKFRLFLVNSLNSIFSSVFLKGVLIKITENTQKNRLKSMFCIVIEFIAVKLLFFVHSALIPGNKMQSSVEACCCLYLSSFHLSKFARHLVNHLLEAFLLLLFFLDISIEMHLWKSKWKRHHLLFVYCNVHIFLFGYFDRSTGNRLLF